MRIVNLLVLLFALFAMAQTLRLFARNRSSMRATALWTVIWGAVGFFGLFPQLLDVIMGWTMMKDRMVFLFIVSILVLYAMMFGQSSQNAALKRQVLRLAQEVAILRLGTELAEGDRESGDASRGEV